MVQFGDELRLEREQRGVSLETMCAATKLSQRQLLDVEAGNFRELPGGIFRKGFVRSYLRALNMDEPLWLERFEASYRASGFSEASDADWAHFAENVRNNRLGGKGSGFDRKWLGVLAMAVFLLLLGACVWKFVIAPKLALRGQTARSLSLQSADQPLSELSPNHTSRNRLLVLLVGTNDPFIAATADVSD